MSKQPPPALRINRTDGSFKKTHTWAQIGYSLKQTLVRRPYTLTASRVVVATILGIPTRAYGNRKRLRAPSLTKMKASRRPVACACRQNAIYTIVQMATAKNLPKAKMKEPAARKMCMANPQPVCVPPVKTVRPRV